MKEFEINENRSDREDPNGKKDRQPAYKSFIKDKRDRVPAGKSGEKTEYRRNDYSSRGEGSTGGENRKPYEKRSGESSSYGKRSDSSSSGKSYDRNNDSRGEYKRREPSEYGNRSNYGNRESSSEPDKRRSFNPNFDTSNRPVGHAPKSDRPSYGDRTDRPSYGDRKPYGQKPAYGDRPDRRSDSSEGGEKRAYGDRSSYGNGGEKRTYGDGEKRNYGGDHRSDSRSGDRPSYGDRANRPERGSYGDKKPYGQKSYGDRANSSGEGGEKRAYGDRASYGNGGEKRSYGEKRTYGEGEKRNYGGDHRSDSRGGDRPSYGDRANRSEGSSYGDKKPYGQKSYGDRANSEGGEKRAYGDRASYSNSGEKRSYGDGEKRAYGDRPSYGNSGEKRTYGGDRRSDSREYGSRTSSYGKEGGDRAGRGDRRTPKYNTENYPTFPAPVIEDQIRLNRYISMSGICSRREADEFIQSGVVTVNGTVITELGAKVMQTDEICFNGNVIKNEKKVYIVMNKPKGFVTSVEDPHADKTVMDLLNNGCRERVYPVGRLDKNSLGVLLITNDGDLAKKLMHPSYEKRKVYQVSLDKSLTRVDMDALATGFELEDGEIHADAISYVDEKKTEIGIEIHSGKNRIVRRMFEHLGYKVMKLDRVYFAGLTKQRLKRGEWRFLNPREVQMLRNGQYE